MNEVHVVASKQMLKYFRSISYISQQLEFSESLVDILMILSGWNRNSCY